MIESMVIEFVKIDANNIGLNSFSRLYLAKGLIVFAIRQGVIVAENINYRLAISFDCIVARVIENFSKNLILVWTVYPLERTVCLSHLNDRNFPLQYVTIFLFKLTTLSFDRKNKTTMWKRSARIISLFFAPSFSPFPQPIQMCTYELTY